MADRKKFQIDMINWQGEQKYFTTIYVVERDNQLIPECMDVSTVEFIEKLQQGFLVIRELAETTIVKNIMTEAREFIYKIKSQFSLTESYWQFVERWIHLRKPQVRNTISVQSGDRRFLLTEKYGNFLVRLRNYLHNWEIELGIDASLGQKMNITFSHYPSGGGFMIEHRDTSDEGTVCTLSLTEKGHDYQQGGLFARNEKGDYIDIDSYLKAGDVVMLNAEMRHGVENIDPAEKLNKADYEKGRWMLFAPLQNYSNRNSVLVE